MPRLILLYGFLAGLITAVHWVWLMAGMRPDAGIEGMGGLVRGYLAILVALSMVFVGIKHYRDRKLGGVITFWTAFLMGMGISTIASILYVVGWEVATAISGFDFGKSWADAMVAAARARNAAPAELQRVMQEAADFTRDYANPLFRLPMVFAEIFPVGILVSLISAGILRKRSPAASPSTV